MARKSIPAQITAACAAVRPATPADAVAGFQPQIVASPASTAEASALLSAAAALGLAVVPRGTGTRMHWGNAPERCDVVIETTKLAEVVEHAAGDLVVTVQAGARMDRLSETLADAGQRLALDPPAAGATRAGRGTVGGVLATGAAGPLRLRYGTGRDLLIGITVVRADGTVAKSGGKVVKNVAGYDLGKLFAGSRGTLGLITQATFRLHPLPAHVAYVTTELPSPAEASRALSVATGSEFSPVSAEIYWPSGSAPVHTCIALEGDPESVRARGKALSAVLGPDSAASLHEEPPSWWDAAAQADGTVLQVGFWPGDLAGVLSECRREADKAGLDPVISGSAAAGQLNAALPEDIDPGLVAGFVTALRGALGPEGPMLNHRAGGPAVTTSVVVQHAPPAVAALVDLFGPVPSLPLMRAIKAQFDPGRMMAPGRFAGGI
ncbi:MAG: FAD-binding oxidoreductase [Nocardiopsaceae bacterium]|jgi:glycolate oxidase FAD binding subunit|nr:FAD-binding oxidoreductase [Nocardiopsaceae bacterium]